MTTLPNSGPIARRAADDARANVGVHEQGGENEGQAVSIYLASVGIHFPAAWCGAFTYYRLDAAAKALGLHLPADYPVSGYVPDIKNWAVKKGLWIPVATARANSGTIQKGDLPCFYFAAKGRVAHVGIVQSEWASGFASVEGNTGGGAGVNRDGDGVYQKQRQWNALGTGGGFVRLPF